MIPLQQIQIKSPCDKSWAAMDGDDQKRYCEGCRKNVFNLSAMTARDAQDVINSHDGNLCVRFETRADGGIQTVDAQPPRKRRYAAVFGWAVALIIAGIAGFPHTALAANHRKHSATKHEKRTTLVGYVKVPVPIAIAPAVKPAVGNHPKAPQQPSEIMGGLKPPPPALMGKMAAPPTKFPAKPLSTPPKHANGSAVAPPNREMIGDIAMPVPITSFDPPRLEHPLHK
jgi:predicted Fe-S protein YdhL (DUF1289 family)